MLIIDHDRTIHNSILICHSENGPSNDLYPNSTTILGSSGYY